MKAGIQAVSLWIFTCAGMTKFWYLFNRLLHL